MIKIILLGVLGSIISAMIGTFWYSMKTPMGKIHLQSTGFSKFSKEEQERKVSEMKPKMWKYYFTQMFLSFLTSSFIAFIAIEQKAFNIGSAAIYGEVIGIWLCFSIPIIGQSLLWGNVDLKLRWKKFFSDSISNLVTLVVIIFVFSLII
jgi:hypothetical protein